MDEKGLCRIQPGFRRRADVRRNTLHLQVPVHVCRYRGAPNRAVLSGRHFDVERAPRFRRRAGVPESASKSSRLPGGIENTHAEFAAVPARDGELILANSFGYAEEQAVRVVVCQGRRMRAIEHGLVRRAGYVPDAAHVVHDAHRVGAIRCSGREVNLRLVSLVGVEGLMPDFRVIGSHDRDGARG